MFFLTLLMACSSPTPQAEAPAPVVTAPAPAPSVDATAHTRARSAMQTLGTTLKAELRDKMQAGGPTAALDVCSTSAQSLTATVGNDLAVDVGRSSLRLRNPNNEGPPWVQAWLVAQGERAAEGVDPMTVAATRADGQAVVRVVGPVPVEAQCLVCHGPAQDRAPDLQTALAADYPQDQASGYALGDLRGAIWAEVPVIDTGFDVPLDDGAKWPLDDSTRSAMTVLRGVLAKAPADLSGAHETAAALDAAVSELVAGCEMTGAAHDQLHVFLMALFPAMDTLKNAENLDDAKHSRAVLLALVVEFDAAFA